MYDFESAVRDLDTLMKDATYGVNARIAAINTELGNAPVLATLNTTNALYWQEIPDTGLNYDIILFNYIQSVDAVHVRGSTAGKYQVNSEILFSNSLVDSQLIYRLLRYQRALRDFYKSNWDRLGHTVELEIRELSPVDWLFSKNQQTPYKGIGVSIEIVIA